MSLPAFAELLDESALVKVRPSRAMIMNPATVGEQGAVDAVHRRQFLEGQVMEDGAEEGYRVRRAARDIDDRNTADEVHDADGAGRVRPGGLDSAEGGAGADGDDGGSLGADLGQGVHRRLAADFAVDAAVLGRNASLDDQNEFAGMLGDGLLQYLLCLVACRRHDGFMVIKRNNIEDQMSQVRM